MKILKILFTVIILMTFTINAKAAFVNLWRPFSSCFLQDFNMCGLNNCNTETVDNKTIPFSHNGYICNIQIFYRIRICECPEPVTFIDLDYMKVSLTDCPGLICDLHPGNLEPPPLGCINNPLDKVFYNMLEATMYRDLCRLLFEDIKTQYHCQNKMTYRTYHNGSCMKVCRSILTAQGQDPASIYVNTKCEEEFCCYNEYKFCLDDNNVRQEEFTANTQQMECENGPYPDSDSCLQEGDTVNILGIEYTVESTFNTFCDGSCVVWGPFGE